MTIVLAGNYTQFLDWCRANKVNPRDREILYPGSEESVYGICGIKKVITVGTWARRPDAYAILERVHLRMEMEARK